MNSTPLDRSSVEPTPTHSSPKVLWTAIGALAVAVAALGGVLLHQQNRGGASEPATLAAPAVQAPAPDDFKTVAPQAATPVPPPVNSAAAPATPLPPPVRAPETLPSKLAQAGPAPAPVPAPAPAKVCAVCGHVESVRTVQHAQPTTGVGAVAGGVVGGVVGNQIGNGNGRTAATVLGAVGGGFAGNAIEKHTHTVTAYEVSVRMQNGSLRMVETTTAPPVGKAVTLKGKVLRPADGRM